MKLLLLGGTRFVGRAVVDAALARGHEVTLFTRGRQPNVWGAAVTMLTGDRDPAVAPGLAALAGGSWDAVIDTCGYVPRIVRASAQALHGRTGRYIFVSSISVYREMTRPGVDETAPVLVLDDPASEDIPAHYGALKAACEDVLREVYGARATIVRPGLIVGPHDPTDRFAYWIARFVHPRLLGDRGPDAVVPAPPEQWYQVIDVRDLAAWMVGLAETGAEGVYNACGTPRQWTFGDLVAAAARLGGAAEPRPLWLDEATLLAHQVAPWTGLPLWLPSTEPDSGGFMEVSCARAQATGLTARPLADIVADTAAWLAQRDNTGAWKLPLSAEAERAIASAVARQTS